MKLSLCMIVKPTDKESKLLDRCLKYVHKYVDEICITQAGKKPNKKVSKIIKKYKGKESFFKWVNDFSKARNYNFSQASGKYIIWLDSDDVLNGAEKLPGLIKIMEKERVDIAIMNYLYDFDEYKRCTVKHLKTRVIKKGTVEWAGKLHEDFTELRVLNSYMVKDIEVIHLTDERRAVESGERNIKIALDELRNNPKDPRSYWLAANAYMGIGSPKASEYYKEFVKRSNSEEEKYLAYLNLAEIEKDLQYALMALSLRPTYPNAYFKCAELQYARAKKDIAIDFIEIGLQMPLPETSIIVFNPRDYDYNPLMMLMRIYFELGKYQKVTAILGELLDLYPNDKNLIAKKEVLDRELKEISRVDEYIEKMPKGKEELREYLEELPEEIKAHPKVCVVRNKNFAKTESTGKDVAYFCGYTSKVWNPDVAETKGIGGSEEAVINLSKELAELGWNVTVYNNCGKGEKKYGKVTYKPWWMFNVKDKQDAIILWRSPKLTDYDLNSSKVYIDLHDVLGRGEFTEDRLAKIDKVFVKSQAHKDLFPTIPNEKVAIIPNGVDVRLFNKKIEKNPYLVVNTSSPDRHLDATLSIFEEIIRREPDKPWKLAWYYGWDVYDQVLADDNEMMDWKAKQIERFERLKAMGRAEGGYMINHQEVAKKYLEAGVFLYPTQFYEIHCISATKAVISQCRMVVSDFAALKEVVKTGYIIHTNGEKWEKEKTFGDSANIEAYVNSVIHASKKSISKLTKEIADVTAKEYSWELIGNKWNNILKCRTIGY